MRRRTHGCLSTADTCACCCASPRAYRSQVTTRSTPAAKADGQLAQRGAAPSARSLRKEKDGYDTRHEDKQLATRLRGGGCEAQGRRRRKATRGWHAQLSSLAGIITRVPSNAGIVTRVSSPPGIVRAGGLLSGNSTRFGGVRSTGFCHTRRRRARTPPPGPPLPPLTSAF